jgi:membrane protease subunit (stomatin/prohibitin family)
VAERYGFDHDARVREEQSGGLTLRRQTVALLGREFIAVPDSHKNQLVYKWPDVSIRRYTRAIVAADELALFVNTGKVVQTMGPGRHQIDADELPGLGILVDLATAGRAYRAELFFVANREFPGFTFGGRVDDVQDPQTGLIVTLRVFGDYAIRVTDPIVLITNLLGTVDVTDNSRVSNWVSDQLLKVMRTDITTQIVRNGWPILGLSAYTEDIERSVIAKGNEQLRNYGVAITRMGNFDVNLSPEDSTSLKRLARDTSYSRLAGSFNQYAAGEMQIGAGEGMAQGGGAVSGAFLGAGLGIGGGGAGAQYPPTAPPASGFAGGRPSAYQGPPAPGSQPAGQNQAALPPAGTDAASPAPPPTVACPSCQADNSAGAKFCQNCGQPMAPAKVHCTNCGHELSPGAKFCPECGTPSGGPAAGGPPAS